MIRHASIIPNKYSFSGKCENLAFGDVLNGMG
jgi:hypothetical protein